MLQIRSYKLPVLFIAFGSEVAFESALQRTYQRPFHDLIFYQEVRSVLLKIFNHGVT